MKKALINGISGQDGAYLAQFLLQKGYKVYGTSRKLEDNTSSNLSQLGIQNQIDLFSLELTDYQSVLTLLKKIQPDEIYNLSGQSSVGISFEKPHETFESISGATLNLLEAIRETNNKIKFFNAGSGECFGETHGVPSTEETLFRPCSPYGTAKACASWNIVCYRETYKLFACTGILYNHESPLRSEKFVTQKIIRAACDIAAGRLNKLYLGNITIERDWGWAPDYVEAMWLMLQQKVSDDFIIATGQTHTLEQLIECAFSAVNLDWKKYVESDPTNFRPTDVKTIKANPSKARIKLGWQAKKTMPEIVQIMVKSYQKKMI